jgi:hypothetical protein
MAAPFTSPLPLAPQRNDSEAVYISRANAFVKALEPMRQARLALAGAGLLDQIESAIDAMSEPQKTAVRIEWDHSQTIERDRPFVNLLGPILGPSDEDLDDLFRQAEQL